MSTIELTYIGIMLLMAAGAGLLLSFAFGGLLHAHTKIGQLFIPALLPICAIGISISTLMSGRNLKYAAFAADALSETKGGGTWLLRILTFFMLGLSIATIISKYYKDSRDNNYSESGKSTLHIVFLIYFFSNVAIPAALGVQPAFLHNHYYAAPVFFAVLSAAPRSFDLIITGAKYALHLMVITGLGAAIIKPEMAIQPDYSGLVPGMNFRFWGIGSHPNSTGPLALMALMLEYVQPTRMPILRLLLIMASGAAFFLAQSKTAWAAAFISIWVLSVYRFGITATGKIKPGFVVASFIGLSLLITSATLMRVDKIIDVFSQTQAGADIASFTGRDQIWKVAIETWQDNPIFGYGPNIWNPEFRLKIGMQYALHAHNQFLQNASQAGTIGFISTIFYAFLLVTGGFKAASCTKGASIAITLIVMIRCLTEVPLTITTIFSGDLFTHLFLGAMAAKGLSLSNTVKVPQKSHLIRA